MKKKILYGVGGFFLVCFLIGMCTDSNEQTDSIQEEDSVLVSGCESDSAESTEVMELKSTVVKKSWKTSTEVDEMRGTTNVWTYIISDNEEYFDFPYDGGSRLRLDVRYMKKYGTDVMLTISKGQFGGNEFSGSNFVTIKFDDGQLKKYYFNTSDNGSTDCIFLQKKSELISELKKAKKIMIEAPFFDTGNRVFKFYVDEPLIWEDK